MNINLSTALRTTLGAVTGATFAGVVGHAVTALAVPGWLSHLAAAFAAAFLTAVVHQAGANDNPPMQGQTP